MQGREYTSGLQPLGNAFLVFGATAPREYTLVSWLIASDYRVFFVGGEFLTCPILQLLPKLPHRRLILIINF